MPNIEYTVEEAAKALTTAQEIQEHALESDPIRYIANLIDIFRGEENDDPEHIENRLCETIPMLTPETAERLSQISYGFLCTRHNNPI